MICWTVHQAYFFLCLENVMDFYMKKKSLLWFPHWITWGEQSLLIHFWKVLVYVTQEFVLNWEVHHDLSIKKTKWTSGSGAGMLRCVREELRLHRDRDLSLLCRKRLWLTSCWWKGWGYHPNTQELPLYFTLTGDWWNGQDISSGTIARRWRFALV